MHSEGYSTWFVILSVCLSVCYIPRFLEKVPGIPRYLVFRTLCVCVGVGMGGITWEDPKYPEILSIPHTVSVRG